MTLDFTPPPSGFYDEADCDLAEFAALTGRTVDRADIPQAEDAPGNVPVYDMAKLAPRLDEGATRRALMAEWARILREGAGVFVLKRACSDLDAIDDATAAYEAIIAAERAAGGTGADHFAAAGSNDRIWNSLQKLALTAPATFVRYFACPAVDAACEAWLGPNYQMTAQVNLVHPGGQAQEAHRDYHLGFQTAAISATYPAHVHDLSPLMTLQGGIAHCDMPVEAGPTKLLPFSQLYRPGYAAWRRPDFRAHFEAHFVQLPLRKGDAIFFNPALFHAAGANSSADIHRMVNLLQVSSAFGRAMESVDRGAMCRAVFPALLEAGLPAAGLEAVLGATAEGYSFPTNLDSDPPVGGLAPKTQKALLREAVTEGWVPEHLDRELAAMAARQRP
ncbi:phytanoyl-CoA dioxygenase family protein [Roseibacterium sp. SDUM158016]|uniref:phytanoyl-CoA dioxygenase family protein n=1 Tax=Roseicyclus sediminis TaxID=2980997 RepID=UPI0021D0A49F|nr:phytanoyl-CoA dioxygenase family protein [Roseibacterium sp. SDUM158016]MCU4654375.1 phytanoyl-CoA dioxygenase family protein [Roseibacterium sp. SDUM158016]